MTNLAINLLIGARDQTSGVFNSIKSNAAALAGSIAAYFGVSFFKSAVQDAAEFEKQMDTVRAVSGATAEEMVKLENTAKEMGATTQYTAFEAAQALEELGRAGLSATEQVQALPDVLALATANNLSLADSAGFVVTTIKGMDLQVNDSGRVIDVLTKASASAFTSVEKLGSGLSNVAPIASSMNISLEDTVSMLAAMQNANIDAAGSGTALKGMLLQFKDPASKFNEELAKIGIQSGDFNVVLRELAEKGDSASAALLALGTESGPGMVAMINQGIPALDKMKKGLEESSGAAAEAAKIMSDNFDGAVAGMGSAVDGLRLQLSQPILKPLTQAVSDITGKFQELSSDGTIAKTGQLIADGFSVAMDAGRTTYNTIIDVYTTLNDTGFIAGTKTTLGSVFDVINSTAITLKNILIDTYAVLADSGSYTANIDALKGAFAQASSVVTQLFDGIVSLFSTLSDSSDSLTFGQVLGEVLGGLIQSVTFLVSAFSTGLATIETAFHSITGVGESFASSVLSGIASIQEGMASITFGDVSESWASDALKMRDSANEFAVAMEKSFDKAGNALIKTSDYAQTTRTAWNALGDDTQQASAKISDSAAQMAGAQEELKTAIAKTGETATQAAVAVVAAEQSKATAAKEAATAIVKASDDAKRAEISVIDATTLLKINLSELRGEATTTGTKASEAFITLANTADLTKKEIVKLAEKTIAFAKTKTDVNNMEEAFRGVGLEVGTHPELIKAIQTKVTELGLTLDDIPQKWRNIITATDDAKTAAEAYMAAVNAAADASENAHVQARQQRAQDDIDRQQAYEDQLDRERAARDAERAETRTEQTDFTEQGQQNYNQLDAGGLAILDQLIADNALRRDFMASGEQLVELALATQTRDNASRDRSQQRGAAAEQARADAIAQEEFAQRNAERSERVDNLNASNLPVKQDSPFLNPAPYSPSENPLEQQSPFLRPDKPIEQQQPVSLKTINVTFTAHNKQATASFENASEADNFLDILRTAGSVT